MGMVVTHEIPSLLELHLDLHLDALSFYGSNAPVPGLHPCRVEGPSQDYSVQEDHRGEVGDPYWVDVADRYL